MRPDEIREFAKVAAKRCHQVRPFGQQIDVTTSRQVSICRLCFGPADREGHRYCTTCEGWWGFEPADPRPAVEVTPISLYTLGDRLDDLLTQYRRPAAVGKRRTEHARDLVAGLVGESLQHYKDCQLKEHRGPKPNLVTVPSAEHPADDHPLQAVLDRLPPEWSWGKADALQATGALPVNPPVDSYPVANPNWYAPKRSVRRAKVLLVDDVWDTGAHLHAAVLALKEAGAQVTGAIVIGRRVDPDAGPQAAKLLSWTRAEEFRFDRCCKCEDWPFQPVLGSRDWWPPE